MLLADVRAEASGTTDHLVIEDAALFGEIKGASWATEDRLEVRGYVTLNKHKDLTVSWQITEAGIKAYEGGLSK